MASVRRGRRVPVADLKRRDERGRAAALVRGQHPYGVQPTGNLYMAPDPQAALRSRSEGLGYFAMLPDEVILQCLLAELSPADLLRLGSTSRAFYVYASHDELWKLMVIDRFNGDFDFDATWRRTYMRMCGATLSNVLVPSQLNVRSQTFACFLLYFCYLFDAFLMLLLLSHNISAVNLRPLQLPPLYSDVLFDSWRCSSHELRPSWLSVESIPRRSGLSPAEFISEYESPNLPVILTDVVPSWPAYGTWSLDSLCAAHGDARFIAGEVRISLSRYAQYARQTTDESPLYIFDHAFGETAPALASAYSVPSYFSDDLFRLLGPSRPKHRWILVGPARSGSKFHKDPNSTSAWNAVLTGSKRWIMFPPSVTPPGVFPSEDGATVTAPVSVLDWLTSFLDEARRMATPPLEATVKAGEIIFVPRGWWHLVINVDEGVAITQNYVSRQSLPHVLRFLRDTPELVSGYKGEVPLFEAFEQRLRESEPEMLREALEKVDEMIEQESRGGHSLWKRLKTDGDEQPFSFAFGDDDEVEEENE